MREHRFVLRDWQVRAALAGRLGAVSVLLGPRLPAGAKPLAAADGSGDVKFYTEPSSRVGVSRTPWISPPWEPGGTLLCVETWGSGHVGPWRPESGLGCWYYADGDPPFDVGPHWKKRPSTTLPRDLVRITATVLSVRACRLLDATPEEASAEGDDYYVRAGLPVWQPCDGFDGQRESDGKITAKPYKLVLCAMHKVLPTPEASDFWRWRAEVKVEAR